MLVTIKNPVGIGGSNSKPDVINVQLLLNKFIMVGRLLLFPLVVDGVCKKKTTDAIKSFQALFLGYPHPDGLVELGRATLAALNGDVNQPQKGDANEKTRQSVIATLTGPLITAFDLQGVSISNSDLHEVRKMVEDRRIEVVREASLGENAEYLHFANVMKVAFETAGSSFRKSVIIHESAHAILDMRAIPVTRLKSEAVAFVAQCVFYRQLTGRFIYELPTGPIATVMLRAGNIAVEIAAGLGVTDLALQPLYEAIPKVQGYENALEWFPYDGV